MQHIMQNVIDWTGDVKTCRGRRQGLPWHQQEQHSLADPGRRSIAGSKEKLELATQRRRGWVARRGGCEEVACLLTWVGEAWTRPGGICSLTHWPRQQVDESLANGSEGKRLDEALQAGFETGTRVRAAWVASLNVFFSRISRHIS